MTEKYRAIRSYYSPKTGVIANKPLTSSDLLFDSKFECQVYVRLREIIPDHRIKRQVPLLIKPKTVLNHAIYWKCDFRIYHPVDKTSYWNVEAKGFNTDEFLRNLKYLELFSPEDWQRLKIVTSNSDLKVRHFTPLSLQQLENFLIFNHFAEK